MSIQDQKNIFLKTRRAIKAVAYARRWFNDFTDLKLDSGFLSAFYKNEMLVRGQSSDPFIANDYSGLFWFWFNQRYQRLMNEQAIKQANEEYEALIKEIEDSNIFNILDKTLKYVPYIIGGSLILYAISVFKK
ncbi:MAG: hypothetical protein AB1432_11645 [Bacteroidota bacterium]